MASAAVDAIRRGHDRITINLIRDLANKLRGGPCAPMTDDVATKIPAGNVRRPDVTVQCEALSDEALATTAPRVIFEVLSPGTRAFDQIRKLDEYRSLDSLQHIVFIDSQSVGVMLWSWRPDGPWARTDVEALDSTLALPAIGVELPLRDIYEGVEAAASASDLQARVDLSS